MKSIIVIVGPSGVGKDTVAARLFKEYSDMKYSVSVTTRSPRTGEVDGKDYQFISVEEFKRLSEEDGLVESCLVHGNYYGTLKGDIDGILAGGNFPVLILDVHGFDQMKELYPDSTVGIFIDPPSEEVLELRLRSRGKDSEEVIVKRLAEAKNEIRKSKDQEYGLRVINDDLETCLEEVFGFVNKLRGIR